LYRPIFTKHLVEIRARNVIAQIATIKFLSHDAAPAIGKRHSPTITFGAAKKGAKMETRQEVRLN
jgi:hypothetical protein